MQKTDVLVVGGGLSGLVATWQLQSAGVDVWLMEARPRFGGRILTVGGDEGADCDLGPSWIWPGQPLVTSLLDHFKIPYYEQFAEGMVLFQRPDGHVERIENPSPMQGARRIQGGIHLLTDAMVNEMDRSRRFLAHRITGLSSKKHFTIVDAVSSAGPMQIQAQQVALAIPPRLAAELKFAPELPAETMTTLDATPTWMAGHAKFFAVYAAPFWRDKGLCGTAISQCGPLAEIHDASPNNGRTFSLFGFSGLDAECRSSMGCSEFINQATAQLVALFGREAEEPQAVYFQDWSTEEFTAHTADCQAPTRHPQYGLSPQLGEAWNGKVEFISTETSFSNGGLIEGALAAGLRFAQRITGLNLPPADDMNTPRSANMSWDWLRS